MSRHGRGIVPIYINNFNWLTPVQKLADFFERTSDTDIIIIDNASTYPPLLDWYSECDHKVVRLSGNYGEHAPWDCGIIVSGDDHRAKYSSEYYVLTDPDLSLDSCPADLLDVLEEGARSHPSVTKVGVSLEIIDLPNASPMAENVRQWESQFWRNRCDDRFFEAAIDTTLALYHVDVPFARAKGTGNSLRSDRPYTARHFPWYIDPNRMSREEEYYVRTTQRGHWGTFLQRVLQEGCGPPSP